jgi:DNA polymerase bacteriophage-type
VTVEQIAESIRSGICPGNPMEVIPSALRASFRAPAGKQFVCSDLSLIEVRVIGWLTGCHALNAIFAADRDPYKEFAVEMYQVAYDDVTKFQRQIAKPAVLQCGFGAGGGMLKEDKNGDIYKSGLWGYAESMGVAMTQQQAAEAVAIYRASYPEVPQFWYALEDSVLTILENATKETYSFGRLRVSLYPEKLLAVTLPSGRRLHYLRPAILGDDITFEGLNSVTKQWGRRKLYGSLLTENIVQAIARDILAVGMVRATDAGFTIVAHTHDELLCEENVLDKHHNLAYLSELMTRKINWADGLLIKADGWEGEVYRK